MNRWVVRLRRKNRMSIRRRLTLSFVVILVLFGLNLIIYFWGGQRRSEAVEDLRRAISRQILVASADQHLNNLRKEIALLSQVTADAATGGVAPEEIAEFDQQTSRISGDILKLGQLSDPSGKAAADELHDSFLQLAASWRTFYSNVGVNEIKAITELATKADPLSQRVIQQLVPRLQEEERRRVDASSKTYYDLAQLTNRMTLGIFGISIIVAIAIALLTSRYLSQGLRELKRGAGLIGSGTLEHRIQVNSSDELGDLAQAFNAMSGNLFQARNETTKANQELERRNREVENQKEVSEGLLLNILPAQVARELRENGKVEPKYFEDVTIVFTDFVAFTLSTEKFAAEELVQLLHEYFTAFDHI